MESGCGMDSGHQIWLFRALLRKSFPLTVARRELAYPAATFSFHSMEHRHRVESTRVDACISDSTRHRSPPRRVLCREPSESPCQSEI